MAFGKISINLANFPANAYFHVSAPLHHERFFFYFAYHLSTFECFVQEPDRTDEVLRKAAVADGLEDDSVQFMDRLNQKPENFSKEVETSSVMFRKLPRYCYQGTRGLPLICKMLCRPPRHAIFSSEIKMSSFECKIVLNLAKKINLNKFCGTLIKILCW